MKNKIVKQQKLCVFIKEINWKMTKPSETDNNFHFAKTSDASVKLQPYNNSLPLMLMDQFQLI